MYNWVTLLYGRNDHKWSQINYTSKKKSGMLASAPFLIRQFMSVLGWQFPALKVVEGEWPQGLIFDFEVTCFSFLFFFFYWPEAAPSEPLPSPSDSGGSRARRGGETREWRTPGGAAEVQTRLCAAMTAPPLGPSCSGHSGPDSPLSGHLFCRVNEAWARRCWAFRQLRAGWPLSIRMTTTMCCHDHKQCSELIKPEKMHLRNGWGVLGGKREWGAGLRTETRLHIEMVWILNWLCMHWICTCSKLIINCDS